MFIPRSVASIGSRYFAYSHIGTMAFESESRLQSFPLSCFSSSSIATIYIPASVEHLGTLCFAHANIGCVIFEPDSRLDSIQDRCFQYGSVKSV
jgi:hypothetical protein